MAQRHMPTKKFGSKPTTEEDLPKKEVVPKGNPIRLQVANCKFLNLRTNPNKKAMILSTLSAGTTVVVDEVLDDDWFHISGFGTETEKDKNSKPGYIRSEFTEEV